MISVKKELSRLNQLAMNVPRLKQSTQLALKREAEDAQLLKQSEPQPQPEPSKGKRTAGDKLSNFLPEVKVPRLRDATSPQKVTLKLLSGRSMFIDSVYRDVYKYTYFKIAFMSRVD